MKKFLLSIIVLMLAVSCQAGKVKHYKLQVVREYPHDVTSYTQGLFFKDGVMYESTGEWGSSTLRQVDLATGKALKRQNFGKKYFVEGSVIFEDKLYVLTWTNKVAFIYDPKTLEYKQTYSYPREGWGLTTDGKNLIASDGSSNIFFMKGDFKLERTITVTMDGRAVRNLNELEYIDGKIWANVYTTDMILIINPKSGVVEATVDCSGLLPSKLRKPETDVLNGIAIHDGRIFLTGKKWPKLYEVKLIDKK